MVGHAGLEPATLCLKGRYSTDWVNDPFIMVVGEGFEPSKAEPSDLQSDPFDHSGTPPD